MVNIANVTKYNTISLINLLLTTSTFFASNTTVDSTTVVTKVPAPINAPSENSIPSAESPEATIEDMTSGAPFPNARKVIPAKFCEILRLSLILERETDRNLFDVSDNTKKHNDAIIIKTGLVSHIYSLNVQ